MPWTYEQSTGRLFAPNGELAGRGYAGGNCGNDPEGINNPDMQDCKCVGPIPVGAYAFGAPLPQSKLGPFAIPLIPNAENEMFGRCGFFMHGDTKIPRRASEGCIIMPRSVREACWASEDHQLNVVRGEST